MSGYPTGGCYWIIPESFLAGHHPGHREKNVTLQRLRQLVEAGFTFFVDLTEEEENLLPYAYLRPDIWYVRFPIPDRSVPDSPLLIRGALDVIDEALALNRGVYLHCSGGLGRTGLLAGCWLKEHGYPESAALERLDQLWCDSSHGAAGEKPGSPEQRSYVLEWNKHRNAQAIGL